MEEARKRREALAKMRSLLFHQEAKLKHLARIKSKDYHRRAQRAARAKAGSPPALPHECCWAPGPTRDFNCSASSDRAGSV